MCNRYEVGRELDRERDEQRAGKWIRRPNPDELTPHELSELPEGVRRYIELYGVWPMSDEVS